MTSLDTGRRPLRSAGLVAIFVAGSLGATALYAQIAGQGAAQDAEETTTSDDVHWQLPPPPDHAGEAKADERLATEGLDLPVAVEAREPAVAVTWSAVPAPRDEQIAAPMLPDPAPTVAAGAGKPAEPLLPQSASADTGPSQTAPAPVAAPIVAPVVTPVHVPAPTLAGAPPAATSVKPAAAHRKVVQTPAAGPPASKSVQVVRQSAPLPPRHPVEFADVAGPEEDRLLPPRPIPMTPPPRRRIPVVSNMVDGMNYVGNGLMALMGGY